MPIKRDMVSATFKSQGGFSDEVNVKLPKMRTNTRSEVDQVSRAMEVLGTSYLESYDDIDGSVGKNAVRTRQGNLVKASTSNTKSAADIVYGSSD